MQLTDFTPNSQGIYMPDDDGMILVDLGGTFVRNLGTYPDRDEPDAIGHTQSAPLGSGRITCADKDGNTFELSWYSISRPHQKLDSGETAGEELYPTVGQLLVAMYDPAVKPIDWQFANGRVKPRPRRRPRSG